VKTKGVKNRSHCPLNCAVECFGDRWSLLVVREIIAKGRRTFSQLLGMEEGISTGTLSDRVAMLQDQGIVTRKAREDDRRSVEYGLTPKGKELEPVLSEIVTWVTNNQMTDAAAEAVDSAPRARSRSKNK